MRRMLFVILAVLGFIAFCQNLEAKTIFVSAKVRLEQSVQKWQNRSDCIAIMKRVAHMKPVIDELCREHRVNPRVIYGLIMTESCANPQAVDYMFASGLSDKVHVGLGQLNKYKLPTERAQDKRRIEIAHMWRQTHLYRMKIQRRLKRSESNELEYAHLHSMQVEAELMKKWAKLDPRFDPKWNLEETIFFFKYNLQKCGDESLAIMAHHGGGNDPVRRVIKYARDHEKIVLKPSQVPWYVESRKLTYPKLYNDHKSPGHHYWARKGDGHLTYAFSPMAASIVFNNYWKALPSDVRAKITSCDINSEKVAEKVFSPKRVCTQDAKKVSGREEKKDMFTAFSTIVGWFENNWCELTTGLKMAGHGGGMLLLGVAVLVLGAALIYRVMLPLTIKICDVALFVFGELCQCGLDKLLSILETMFVKDKKRAHQRA